MREGARREDEGVAVGKGDRSAEGRQSAARLIFDREKSLPHLLINNGEILRLAIALYLADAGEEEPCRCVLATTQQSA